MIDQAVSKLAAYALQTGLIQENEYTWAINTILDTLKLDSYTDPGQEWEELELAPILEELLNDAYARGVLAENSVVYRDLFDTELMGRLTPRPALVTNLFQKLYEKSPREATDWYYKFSQDTNYIRRDRIAKDMQWKAPTEYGEPHNTITPIARRRGEKFELDLVLRNNITTREQPLGVYHPHAELHHIKKENIGLIEVMGLAVLPARLKEELAEVAAGLANGFDLRANELTEKRAGWAEGFAKNYTITKDNALDIVQKETGLVFAQVLEHAGVYKRNNSGKQAFVEFLEKVK